MSYPGLTKRTAFNISFEEANRLDIPCGKGHVGRWRPFKLKNSVSRYCFECDRIRKRRSSYGISELEYQALITEQGDLCALCDKKKKLVVDHDHNTGKVRGLLCFRCNIALGLVEHGFADKAQDYLHLKKSAKQTT